MFSRNGKKKTSLYLTRYVWSSVRLVRAPPESGGDLLELHYSNNLCFSRDWSPAGSRQRPTPRLRGAPVVEIGRNLGCARNETQNNPQPNVCTSLAEGYIYTAPRWNLQPAKLRDARDGVGLWGRRVHQTAINRRQRETTHEEFSCIWNCERVAQKNRENATIFHFTQREHSTTRATPPMKKWPSLEDWCSPGRWYIS